MNGHEHQNWRRGAHVTAQEQLDESVRALLADDTGWDSFTENTPDDRLSAARGIVTAATMVIALALIVIFAAHYARAAIIAIQ